VTGNHDERADGLQISFEKMPIPSLAHTPIASLAEMINWAMTPDSSTLAPTLTTPIPNDAPGMGVLIVNAAVHVFPTLRLPLIRDARAVYPKLEGDAHGIIRADAPIVI